MKKNNIFVKTIFTCFILWSLIVSVVFATTQKWREIIGQLRDDWWPDEEIKVVMEDLWYKAEEYLWDNIDSNINVIRKSSDSDNDLISVAWQNILKELVEKWRSDEEIIKAIENMWYDPSVYFSGMTSYSWYSETTYISRSCKSYNIEYISLLGVYTSPDFQKKEYFINIEYIKKYIDSKNIQKEWCPINSGWIIKSYRDMSSNSDSYVAPNGKVYFITQKNWLYYSSDLMNSAKWFLTLSEIKYYIRDRNPLN